MKTYQVFDCEGKVCGSVTADSIADACRKAREGFCDFPTLVEMPENVAITIQKVVDEKTKAELYIASIIEETLARFSNKTGVPVEHIGIKLSHYTEIGLEKMDIRADVEFWLNINEAH